MIAPDLGQLAAFNEPVAAGLVGDQEMDVAPPYSQDVDLALSESSAFNFGAATSRIPGQRRSGPSLTPRLIWPRTNAFDT